jgi:hypothetical protein
VVFTAAQSHASCSAMTGSIIAKAAKIVLCPEKYFLEISK